MRMRWGAVAVLLLLASCAAPPPPPLPPGAVPVVLVHGYGAEPSVFDDVRAHLEEAGYPPDHLLAVDLEPAVGGNAEAASGAVAAAVDEVLARTGSGPEGRVDIVAHSMGALSSRWYATVLHPERVRTLVTVGGANHGTDALCGEPTPGGRDLCPAFADVPGSVQVRLNGTPAAPSDETPYGAGADRPGTTPVPPDDRRAIRYVSLLVPEDRWIVPRTSSELDGADPVGALPDPAAVREVRPGNLEFVGPTDHDGILQEERFAVLLRALLLDQGAGPAGAD